MLTNLVRPMNPGPLAIARIVTGAAALLRSFIALPVLLDLSQPEILKIPLVDWLPTPTPVVAWVSIGIWAAASILVAIGWRLPISGTVLIAALTFHVLLDGQLYANHLYLMTWLVLLLIVADAGAGRSVERRPRQVANWTLLLITLQISIVYFFSAITKINSGFLSGSVLAGFLRNGVVPFPESLRTPRVLGVMAILTILVEAFLAFGLWVPRYRRVAYILGIGLHLAIPLLMPDTEELIVFSLLMLGTYPLFAQVSPEPESSQPLIRSAA